MGLLRFRNKCPLHGRGRHTMKRQHPLKDCLLMKAAVQ
jgi:hypothetical protein